MITKIRLKNWRSHLDTALDFSEGTNALVGIVGSGKSSILDAMCFGLFGTFPALQARKLRIEDVIMRKPKDQKDAEVEVFFEEGGAQWSIKRAISKVKATSAELRKGQQLVEGPQPSRVNEALQKLLKMDYDLFTRAIYTEQNQIDMFLTIPKGQRMKKIDELLAIDKFERARATVISVVSKVENSAHDKSGLLASLENDPSLKLVPGLKRELQEAENERRQMEQRLSTTDSDTKRLERNVAEMRAKREQMVIVSQQLETSVALLKALEQDVESLKRELTIEEIRYAEMGDGEIKSKLESLSKRESELREQMEEESAQLRSLTQIIAAKTAKIISLQNEKIPELEEKIKERERLEKLLKKDKPEKLAEEISELHENLDKAQQQMQRAEGQITQIEESLSELEEVEDSCPICDQKLTKEKKSQIIKLKKAHISRLRATIEKAEAEIEGFKEKISDLEARLENAKTFGIRLADMKELEPQIKVAKGEIKFLQREVAGHETELKMQEKSNRLLENDLDDVRKEKERFRIVMSKREQLLSKTKRSRQLQDEIIILEGKKALLRGFSQAELERLENEYVHTRSFQSALRAKLENAVGIEHEKKMRISEIETKQKQIESYRLEIEKLESLSKQFSIVASALESTQGQLRKNFVSAVNMTMHEIWQNMYPYKDFYSCRLNIEEGDYVLELQDSTGWIAADGVASGGERAMACLALRIAFSLVLAPQLRWLVLDEPTANLDENSVEILASILRDKIRDFVDQCFVITHDEKLKEAVSGFCYEFHRDKSRDEPTKVSLFNLAP